MNQVKVYFNPWLLRHCNSASARLFGQVNGVQHQVAGLVDNDAAAIQVEDHGQIQYALLVRNICYSSAVGLVHMQLLAERVLVFMYLLLLFATPDLRKQAIFLHDTQVGLGITVDASFLQHLPHSAAAICVTDALSLFRDDFCKARVFLRPAQTIVSASGYL